MVKIVEPAYEIINFPSGALSLIERCGRVAYKSEDKITDESAPNFVEMVVTRGHESVIEHAVMGVWFLTDRGISHELVRHRLASYTQESTRYVDYGKAGEITVIKPSGIEDGSRADELWLDAVKDAEFSYNTMRTAGAPPQVARSVLPTCTKTEIIATANLREWKHILELRCGAAAHPDIARLMKPLRAELRERLPQIFGRESERD
ncbi:thymidylate synthase [Alphaproteobacteria bacterium]|nr:thymidylate synthase [Alphaproteobacteria bacterium]